MRNDYQGAPQSAYPNSSGVGPRSAPPPSSRPPASMAPHSMAPRSFAPAPAPVHSQRPNNAVFYRQAPVSEAYPPAPNSLAPVEMYRHAHNTDRALAMANTNTHSIAAQRPSIKTGIMILIAGVFVGGTFGIGVQARRNAEAQQAEVAAAAVTPQATQAAAPILPAAQPAAPPQQAPPNAYAQAPVPAPRPTNLPPGAIVIPPQQGVVVVPATSQPIAMAPAPVAQPQAAVAAPAPQPQAAPAPAKKPSYAWHTPAPQRPTGMVAAKVTPPPKAEKPAAPPPEKPEPAEKPAKAAKGGKGGTSAQDVLQAAIGETTNTL